MIENEKAKPIGNSVGDVVTQVVIADFWDDVTEPVIDLNQQFWERTHGKLSPEEGEPYRLSWNFARDEYDRAMMMEWWGEIYNSDVPDMNEFYQYCLMTDVAYQVGKYLDELPRRNMIITSKKVVSSKKL